MQHWVGAYPPVWGWRTAAAEKRAAVAAGAQRVCVHLKAGLGRKLAGRKASEAGGCGGLSVSEYLRRSIKKIISYFVINMCFLILGFSFDSNFVPRNQIRIFLNLISSFKLGNRVTIAIHIGIFFVFVFQTPVILFTWQ